MDFISDTPFAAAYVAWPLKFPQWSMTVVAKGTFQLRHGELARITQRQHPCTGDRYVDDDHERALVYSSDFALIKKCGEYLFEGACHPPGGPVQTCPVSLRVGRSTKKLAVIGHRHWKAMGSGMSEPEPFEALPLSWEVAYGGQGFTHNPVGQGYVDKRSHKGRVSLPNLEDLKRPIASLGDRPDPVGFFPLAPQWNSRARYAGSYGGNWRRERSPYFPDDFDIGYYNAAPEDQWISGFFRGDEELELVNLVEGMPQFKTKLPGLTVRAFVIRKDEPDQLEEVPFVLDTIHIDGENLEAQCVWRGYFPIAGSQPDEIDTLFVMSEPEARKTPAKQCLERLRATILLRQLERQGFSPRKEELNDVAATKVLERWVEESAGKEAASKTMALLASSEELPDGVTLLDLSTAESPEQSADATEETSEEQEPDMSSASSGEEKTAPATANPEEAVQDIHQTMEAFAREANLIPEGQSLQQALEALPDAAEVSPSPSFSESVAALFAKPEAKGILAEFGLAGVESFDDLLAACTPSVSFAEAEDRAVSEGKGDVSPAPLPEAPLDATKRDRLQRIHQDSALVEGDFSEVDASGLDLAGLNARQGFLKGADFSGSGLEGAAFDGVLLSGANLVGAKLQGATFRDADLTGANLRGADLRGADMKGALLDRACLDGVCLDGAKMQKASIREATFDDASLRQVDATSADFSRSRMSDIDASNSTFAEARMYGVEATKIRMTDCDLRDLRAKEGANFDDADLRRSNADGARFSKSSLKGINLAFVSLKRSDFSEANLERAILSATDARHARFLQTRLNGVEAVEANFMKACFRDADLSSADLRGCNLFRVDVFGAQLGEIRLELANVSQSGLEGM